MASTKTNDKASDKANDKGRIMAPWARTVHSEMHGRLCSVLWILANGSPASFAVLTSGKIIPDSVWSLLVNGTFPERWEEDSALASALLTLAMHGLFPVGDLKKALEPSPFQGSAADKGQRKVFEEKIFSALRERIGAPKASDTGLASDLASLIG